ncbi:hypothetical protein CRUP_028922, partial [Coryphaenoides rupestris]
LTLLLPYLLTRRRRWSGCVVRVFVGGDDSLKEQQKEEVLVLIKKFRLGFHDVRVLPDIYGKPQPEHIRQFENMLDPFREEADLKSEISGSPTAGIDPARPWMVTDRCLERNRAKIRLNEILKDNSDDAALIVTTMPIGRRGVCPSALYLAWLDFLSHDLRPPVLMVRGNQESVLTFYCQ